MILALRPAVFDGEVFPLNMAQLAELLSECFDVMAFQVSRRCAEIPDHWHRLLLRARSEWPCRHCAGEKSYEIASPHARPLALTASRDYGSRGPPRIDWAKGSFPPRPPFCLSTAARQANFARRQDRQ